MQEESEMGLQAAKNKAVIFLHIPRVGGTTLKTIMRRQYDRRFVYEGVHNALPEFKGLDESARAKIQVLEGHMPFGLHAFLPQPATYVTLLREPVDRVISIYYYVLRSPRHYAHAQVSAQQIDLETFVSGEIAKGVDNGQTRLISGVGSTPDFDGCSRETLELAKKNLREHFSVIGLTKKFDETLILLKRTLGWGLPFYTRKNITRERPYRSNPPQALVKLIRQRNKWDVELYEYAQERMEEQLRGQPAAFVRDLERFRTLNRLYTPLGRLEARLRRGTPS
jgi:hypothetical protein